MQLYMSWYIRSFFGFTFLNILYFFKYSCTNIFHRRSLYTFYFYWTRIIPSHQVSCGCMHRDTPFPHATRWLIQTKLKLLFRVWHANTFSGDHLRTNDSQYDEREPDGLCPSHGTHSETDGSGSCPCRCSPCSNHQNLAQLADMIKCQNRLTKQERAKLGEGTFINSVEKLTKSVNDLWADFKLALGAQTYCQCSGCCGGWNPQSCAEATGSTKGCWTDPHGSINFHTPLSTPPPPHTHTHTPSPTPPHTHTLHTHIPHPTTPYSIRPSLTEW